MKNIFILLFTICSSSSLFAQLSGTYTIDKSAPSSSTNFVSFNAATDSLISQGISGDVELSVASGSGPYTEQVTVPYINGSGNYSLTIDGNEEELNFADSTSFGKYVISYDSAKNCVLKNLTIKSLSVKRTPICIEIQNGCENITIENNDIFGPKRSSFNHHFTVGISVADSIYINDYGTPYPDDPAYLSTINGNSTTINIKGNTVKDAMFGIVAMYNDEYRGSNIIQDNIIIDFAYMGILVGGGNDTIRRNDISRPTIGNVDFSNEGIFAINAAGGDYNGALIISENLIHTILGESTGGSTGTWNRVAIASDGRKRIGVFGYLATTRSYNVRIENNIIRMLDVNYGNLIVSNNSGDIDILSNDISYNSSKDLSEDITGILVDGRGQHNSSSNVNIANNKVSIMYSGQTLYGWQFLRGIDARSVFNSTNISNNIVSITASNVSVSNTTKDNGIEAISCDGNEDTKYLLAYNTIVTKHINDSISDTKAFYLGNGDHSLTNNLVSFENLTSKGTFISSYDNALWTATHNSIHYTDSLIFSNDYGTTNNTYKLSDFDAVSGGANILENPNFVDAASGDYRPTNTNILNGGMYIPSVLVDHYGATRLTSTPDIGAIEVFTQNPLSVEDIQESDILLYPNPTLGIVQISTTESIREVTVYNTNGQITLIGNGNTLDLSGCSRGLYIVKVETAKGVFNKKLLVN